MAWNESFDSRGGEIIKTTHPYYRAAGEYNDCLVTGSETGTRALFCVREVRSVSKATPILLHSNRVQGFNLDVKYIMHTDTDVTTHKRSVAFQSGTPLHLVPKQIGAKVGQRARPALDSSITASSVEKQQGPAETPTESTLAILFLGVDQSQPSEILQKATLTLRFCLFFLTHKIISSYSYSGIKETGWISPGLMNPWIVDTDVLNWA